MKTLVAIPCMSMVHTMFLASILQLKVKGDIEFSLTESSLIYDARNRLAKKAVDDGFDRILWLDSDMMFDRDVMLRLSDRIDEGCEYVSALYFTRKLPIEPVIYIESGIYKQDIPIATPYREYPEGLFEISGSGFGCVMMTTELVRTVDKEFGLPFSPILGFGEDLSFCAKVARTGHKMYCDSTIKCKHIGFKQFDESDYLLKGVKQWSV